MIAKAADDQATLEREALAGSQSAWEALIKKHGHTVLLAVVRYEMQFDRAEDLVQQSWERLWRQCLQGRLKRLSLPGLAIRQARYLFLQGLRNRAPVDLASDLELALLNATDSSAEDHLLEAEEHRLHEEGVRRIEHDLERCPPRQREIFQFARKNPEMPHREVAQRFRISEERVRHILCDVRKHLRAAWKDPNG